MDKTEQMSFVLFLCRNTNTTYDASMVAVALLMLAVEAADRADLAAETTLILVPKRNVINNTNRKLRRGCMTNE